MNDSTIETTLEDVPIGGEAVIKKVGIHGQVKRRLMDMGLVTGAKVKVIRAAPLGDPLEIRVKDCFISVRRDDARHILIEV